MTEIDALAELMGALARKNGPWVWHENPETGELAIFPKTAKDEAAWESRALLMHAAQITITLDPKPTENEFARQRMVRGD